MQQFVKSFLKHQVFKNQLLNWLQQCSQIDWIFMLTQIAAKMTQEFKIE